MSESLDESCPGGLKGCACCARAERYRDAEGQAWAAAHRPTWKVAWMVAKRRLEHPEPSDMLNSATNIVQSIEAIVESLFDIIEGHDEEHDNA